jgi:hypothetical protein
MSGIILLSENYVRGAELELTEGTEHAQFPLSNLLNSSPSVKFRGVGNTVKLVLDLLQTRDIGAVAIAGDPNADFALSAVSAKFSTTLDFSESTPVNLVLSGEHSMGYVVFEQVSRRFVELTLTGAGLVEIGSLFVGQAINLPQQNFAISSFEYGYDDLSESRANRYGQVFVDALPLIKSLTGDLEHCTLEEQELLDSIFTWHGTKRPLWVLVDSEGNGMNGGQFKLTCYGYLAEVPKWRASGGKHFTCSVLVRQAG